MKGIVNYIKESRYSRFNNTKTTLYFSSMSAFLIFKYEVEGQISDGYWENSRPFDHYKWINSNITYVVDENHDMGYEGPTHNRKYNCSWITTELNKALKGTNDDYAWLSRAMHYGRAGRVFDKSKIDLLSKKYAVEYILEILPEEPITVEEFENTLSKERDYVMKYWNDAKDIINDDFLKKYYETEYTFKDFKNDVNDVQETINTQIGGEEF